MLDATFTVLYDALSGSVWIAAAASFGWGILSILLSPCHLSGIPLVVGFIASQGKISFGRTFSIALVFAVGILTTIALIGIVTASAGRLMGDVGSTGNYLVAGIFFIVGLYLLEAITLPWNAFSLQPTAARGLIAGFILGLLFGIALGPCTFAYMAPVLGVVFETAQTDYLFSLSLLASFGVGHCVVIVGAGIATQRVQRYLNWSGNSTLLRRIKQACGLLVILGGVYLLWTA